MEFYTEWCKLNNCSHAHCTLECEHPQPFIMDDKLYCGRCWFIRNQLTEMIACTPEVCD